MTLNQEEIEQLRAIFKRVNKGQAKVSMHIDYEHKGEALLVIRFNDSIDNKYLGSFESPVEVEEE